MSNPNPLLLEYPWLQEFIDSGISPELALANVQWLDKEDAIKFFLEDVLPQQRQNIHLNSDGARLQRQYIHLWDGAWAAKTELCPVPYVKPVSPRISREKGKPIKYETPPGAQALPLFPVLDYKRFMAGEAIQKAGIDLWEDYGESLWITEGLKKALSLVDLGRLTVALRGVTQWHPKGSRELWPQLADQIRPGRVVYLVFDQDDKVKTRFNVANQCLQLAQAIERAGGVVRVLTWDGAQGKGIDDYLASHGDRYGAQGALYQLQKKALTLTQYRRRATIARAAAVLAAELPSAQRQTTGEYLPQLPPVRRGAIQWLDAPMNSGKTVRMGADWVAPWVAAGGLAVVLSPLNSLGMQTAQDWNLPHIHEYKTDSDSRRALEADISQRGGIVACFNSVHRVISLLPGDRPLLLVIDEAAQVLTGAGEGGTLKGNWAERWEDFISLTRRAAAIALAEAGLDQATVDLVKTLSGVPLVLGNRHQKEGQPWDVEIHQATPLSGFRANLLTALGAGETILFVSSSQAEGRRLERAAQQKGIKVIRIDSETNEGGRFRDFFECPEAWLYQAQPQLLILSPSAKTGLSIEGGVSPAGAYFGAVYGYFPSLDTDTHLQLLGRYRPAVPRVLWCPAYIQPGVNEKPSKLAITHGLAGEAANYARAGGFDQSAADSDNEAITQYLAARWARGWAQKINPCGALVDALGAAGHSVEVNSETAKDNTVIELWGAIKEELAREDSSIYAGIQLKDSHTAKWANEVLSGLDSTYLDRCTAQKVRTVIRFPGLDWNCPELWYSAQFAPKDDLSGPLAPGAALWAEAEHYKAIWGDDAKEAQQILTQRLRAAHLLPTGGARAALASIFRPLVETLLEAGEVAPGGAVEAQIKALAVTHSEQLRRFWRLSITGDQSDTAIANKVARKFGLVLARSRRVINGVTATGKPKQEWVYSIEADPVWRALVGARKWALEQCTNSLNKALSRFVHSSPADFGNDPPDPPDLPLPTPDQGGGLGNLPLTA